MEGEALRPGCGRQAGPLWCFGSPAVGLGCLGSGGSVSKCPPWRMGSGSPSCPHLIPGCVALPEPTFSSACPCEVASGSPFPRVPQIHPPGVSPAFRFPRAGWTHIMSLPRFPSTWPPEGAEEERLLWLLGGQVLCGRAWKTPACAWWGDAASPWPPTTSQTPVPQYS